MPRRADRIRELSRTQLALLLYEEHQQVHRSKIKSERMWFFLFTALAVLNAVTDRDILTFVLDFVLMAGAVVFWHKEQEKSEQCLHRMQDQINEIVFDDYSGRLRIDWEQMEVVERDEAQR